MNQQNNSWKRGFGYLKLLLPVKWHFLAALVAGGVFAVSSGVGLPFMSQWIFPRVFKGEAFSTREQPSVELEVAATGGARPVSVTFGDLPPQQVVPVADSAALHVTIGAGDRLKPMDVALETPSGPSSVKVSHVVDAQVRWTHFQVFLFCLSLPLIFLIRGVSEYFNAFLLNYCGISILHELRRRVFRKLQRLPMAYFSKQRRGDLISRTMGDTAVIQQSVLVLSNDLMKQPLTLVSGAFSLFYLSWKSNCLGFVLFTMLIVPLCIFPIRYVGKRLFKRAKLMQEQAGSVTECFSENIGAIREIRAFSLEDQQTRVFHDLTEEFFRLQVKMVKYSKILSPAIEVCASIGIALAIWYAAYVEVSLGDVIPLMFAMQVCYEPLKKLGRIHNDLKQCAASMDRVEEVLDAPETVADKPGAMILPPVRGEIAFEDVDFAYENELVLRGVTCRLEAGRVYALVGPSGSGKSTFMSLVQRLFDPVSGVVRIDGHDMRDVTVASLRGQMALVPQDPVLFNMSIIENIRLSRPGATDDEVFEAARQANAHDFIMGFPDGYATVVGERGARLSGGQKQRIAIARACLRNAPVLLLDEATSALDSESEEKVQAALGRLVVGRTVLLIAHRFSTLRIANQILVFDEGRIVSTGSHVELYGKCALYTELYDRQAL